MALPSRALPGVLQAVGFTSKPCGILLVQDPDDLHLQGYPRSKVKCTYSVCGPGAERQAVSVERHLVQIGFAEPVSMTKHGEEVAIGITLKKMQAKCSKNRGWQDSTIPAGILTSWLEKFIPTEAFATVQSRMDGSFTFMCHQDYCEAVLRASGTDGVFAKMHQDSQHEPLELLWLDRAVTLQDALEAAKEASVFGLAEKGSQGFLALRFKNHGELTRYAKAHGHTHDWELQRWKVSGVPAATGIVGLHELLNSLSWSVDEIIYQDEKHAVFTASAKGKSDPAHYTLDMQPRTIRFKALNATAKKAIAEESQTVRKQLFQTPNRAAGQKAFLAKTMNRAKVSLQVDPAVLSKMQSVPDLCHFQGDSLMG